MILILLIVLLVPLRLNVKARYDQEMRARVHVSWLLRAVHVKFEWLKDHGLLRAKLLGLKTLMKKHIGDWGPQPEEAEEAAEGESVPAEPGEEPASSDAPASSAAASSGTAEAPEEKPSETEEKPSEAEEKPSATEEKPAEEAKPSSAPKPDGKEEKKEEKPEAAGPAEEAGGAEAEEDLPRLAEIEMKLDQIAGKLDEFQGYWYDEKNRKTVRLIGKQLKKIGRHLKPTHFLVEGELGFGDPAKTGKIMGTLYSFYPIFRDSIRISGNYEEQVVRLRLELKGRLRLGIFIEVALRLLLNRNLRRWIKKLTHKDKDEDTKETEETAEAADREQKAA